MSSEDDNSGRSAMPNGSGKSLTLRRIAGALQVPPSALYAPPNAVGSASQSGSSPVAFDGRIEDECLTLLRAYQRIRDPEERRRLLALVDEAAEPT